MYVYDIATYFFRTDFSALTFQRFDHTGASFESREYWQCSDATRFETPDSRIWKRSWGRDHLALNLLVALGWRTFQSHVPFTGLCVIDSALPMTRITSDFRGWLWFPFFGTMAVSQSEGCVLASRVLWRWDSGSRKWKSKSTAKSTRCYSCHRQSTVNHEQPGERHMWLECT